MAKQANVFISYVADTKPLAEELTQALQRQGFGAWADFKDLQPGQRWQEEIERALEMADWYLILVGPQSYATRWQEAEWRAALEKAWTNPRKTLLPIVVGGGDPPPFFRSWVSLRVDPETEPGNWTRHVLDALKTPRDRVRDLSPEDLRARRERLDEIGRAAEHLASIEAGPTHPPERKD